MLRWNATRARWAETYASRAFQTRLDRRAGRDGVTAVLGRVFCEECCWYVFLARFDSASCVRECCTLERKCIPRAALVHSHAIVATSSRFSGYAVVQWWRDTRRFRALGKTTVRLGDLPIFGRLPSHGREISLEPTRPRLRSSVQSSRPYQSGCRGRCRENNHELLDLKRKLIPDR